jgi:hypothetical protein
MHPGSFSGWQQDCQDASKLAVHHKRDLAAVACCDVLWLRPAVFTNHLASRKPLFPVVQSAVSRPQSRSILSHRGHTDSLCKLNRCSGIHVGSL